MSNGTIHSAAEITAGSDEIGEYLRTGDENRQALMHANLLLTNLMRLLRPIMKPGNTAQRLPIRETGRRVTLAVSLSFGSFLRGLFGGSLHCGFGYMQRAELLSVLGECG